MAFEIPLDLIKQVQISLRNEAQVPSYDSGPNLPSLEGSVSELDPSPPSLRCKYCKAKLLRGIQSLICVFCGKEQATSDNPPDAIKFTSTFGYRWFLLSLNLDGSEMVGPSVEPNESKRGQNALQEEFPLSDLLDLEIKWSAQEEKLTSSVVNERSVQNKSPLNLAGVDVDNFFIEGRGENISGARKVQLEQSKPKEGMDDNASQRYGNLSFLNSNESTGNTAIQHHGNLSLFENKGDIGSSSFQGHENPSLFENVQPTEAAARSLENNRGDSFSGWDATFQSTGTETLHQEPKSYDFMDSSVDLSAHMDTIFGSGRDLSYEKPKDGSIASVSNTDDWFQDDFWSNSNPRESHNAQKTVATGNVKDVGTVEYHANISSSMTVDWIPDNSWQNGTDMAADKKTTDENDDSFDAWSDFTSSTGTRNHSIGSLAQTGVTFQSENFDGTVNIKDGGRLEDANNSSSMDVDWIQNDQWKISRSPETVIKNSDQEDDSFDAWNDFTSSPVVQVPSSSSTGQTANNMTLSVERTSEIKLFNESSEPQDVDFGGFTQPDFFAGAFSTQMDSTDVIVAQSEASASNRMDDVAGGGRNVEEAGKGDVSSVTANPNTADVEMLMSQMHDLSFMLESNLSIPHKSR